MNAPRKVAVVTGSRAEYGLLYWVLHDLRATPDVELLLIVTGMHLSPEFGMTVKEIERDGFAIARRSRRAGTAVLASGPCDPSLLRRGSGSSAARSPRSR